MTGTDGDSSVTSCQLAASRCVVRGANAVRQANSIPDRSVRWTVVKAGTRANRSTAVAAVVDAPLNAFFHRLGAGTGLLVGSEGKPGRPPAAGDGGVPGCVHLQPRRPISTYRLPRRSFSGQQPSSVCRSRSRRAPLRCCGAASWRALVHFVKGLRFWHAGGATPT